MTPASSLPKKINNGRQCGMKKFNMQLLIALSFFFYFYFLGILLKIITDPSECTSRH